MTHLRVSEAAALVGVSDDTLRRWIKYDAIETSVDDGGRTVIAGEDLADWQDLAEQTAQARQWFQEAASKGAECGDLAPVLEDKYDLEKDLK